MSVMSEIRYAALEGLHEWLPGELDHSETKAPYEEKINRAHLPITDRQSMYGFIGEQWHTFRMRADEGVHYLQQAGARSGQLMLAKVYSGFVDKVAMGIWLKQHQPADDDAKSRAQWQAVNTVDHLGHSWAGGDKTIEQVLAMDWPDTPFGLSIEVIMAGVRAADRATANGVDPALATMASNLVINEAAGAAKMAEWCYGLYAERHLQEGQFALPASVRVERPT